MVYKAQLTVFSLILLLTMVMASTPATAASDLLPDLGMARLRDLTIENTADGRRLLRFTAVIVNVGAGALELRGQRPDTTSAWTVEQRIYDDAGSSRYVATAPQTTFIFGGDGHNHWHIQDLQRHELDRLDNGGLVGTGAKRGFCFYDNEAYRLDIPSAPQSPVYTTSNSCTGGATALQTTMGLSIGWGDRYSYQLPDQYIDITGLAAGNYRLWALGDPFQWFQETNEANNDTWVDIRLTGSGLTILDYGPSPYPEEPAPSGNLLANPGFEEDANGDSRPDSWSTNQRFTRSSEVVSAGSYAGKHAATDNGSYNIGQRVTVTPKNRYTVLGQVNIPATTDSFSFQVRIIWRDANGNILKNQTLRTYTTATNGWDQVSVSQRLVPTGAVTAEIRLVASSLNATIYVDDFEFSQ
jgi:hypothetical protein